LVKKHDWSRNDQQIPEEVISHSLRTISPSHVGIARYSGRRSAFLPAGLLGPLARSAITAAGLPGPFARSERLGPLLDTKVVPSVEHCFFLSPPEGGLDLVTNRQGTI